MRYGSFGRTRHGENQRFVSDARYRRDCNVEVPISSNDNIRNTSPNLQLHGRTTAAMLREPDHLRQASTTRNQHHLYIVAGDPRDT